MLRITADVYSGRENPAWTIEDEFRAREIMDEAIQARRSLASLEVQAPPGLGFRGLIVEPTSDEMFVGLPPESAALRIPVEFASDPGGRGLIERLIRTLSEPAVAARMAQGRQRAEQAVESVQQFLLEQIAGGLRRTVQEGAEIGAGEAQMLVTCAYEISPYNPGFWNNDPTVRTKNNCYNYASNKRTNTFAQPGRGCGSMYTALNCAEVTRASLCDGMHRRYDCFPDSEKPRYLAALVMWPDRDFHWYRLNSENFWSHKPGSTIARNVDNAGVTIRDPRTCDRGPYTQFCGFFYTSRSQRIS
ncbi:hypothetical protein BE17_15910 [Sorangium cellulosum]|uniref:Uncharacterized protein n=1 Tax=Sorangium cellulosum TaxID=56 RepID=A0A150RJZ8_SORCE|nr:hypothetical protein BE17_15910 [Sorangium cellulosum]